MPMVWFYLLFGSLCIVRPISLSKLEDAQYSGYTDVNDVPYCLCSDHKFKPVCY